MIMNSKQEYTPLTKEEYQSIKPGDYIERMLGFQIPVIFKVIEVKDNLIKAEDVVGFGADWDFDATTGLEVDDDIPVMVSYIRRILKPEEVEKAIAGEKERTAGLTK
jgi:hypothetical protein